MGSGGWGDPQILTWGRQAPLLKPIFKKGKRKLNPKPTLKSSSQNLTGSSGTEWGVAELTHTLTRDGHQEMEMPQLPAGVLRPVAEV